MQNRLKMAHENFRHMTFNLRQANMNNRWANMLLSLVLQRGDSNQFQQDGPPLLSSAVMRPQRVAGDEKRGIYKASYPHDGTIQDYIVIR